MAQPSATIDPGPPGDFDRLLRAVIGRSVRYRRAAVLAALAIIAGGVWSALHLRLDVTPDIGNVQVQVLTRVPNLSPEEIEASVTRPVELAMFGLPGLEQVRSLTRFGISQVCLVFSEGTEVYRARQLVAERLAEAGQRLPAGLSPTLAPPSAGLGEIFTYALAFKSNSPAATGDAEAGLRRLKLAQEFTVKPCLKAVPGIAEVNTTGGYDQQMVVAVDPDKAGALGLDLDDIAGIVQRNAAIGGGALVERDGQQFIIRSRARAQTIADLTNLCVKLPWTLRGIPLASVATVSLGSGLRLGAATCNGREAVLGTAMMMTGGNARGVARSFRQALAEAQSRLPADMELRPLYDRAELVDGVVATVRDNLLLAAGLVLAVLLVFLRSGRAALVVASVLVLSFGLGLTGMAVLGMVGSLLTLGAIDFGVVVDDTIVMVENVARRLAAAPPGTGPAARTARLKLIVEACCQVRQPMLVGMLIIIGAYVPILTLDGVEGRMFRPLAGAVMLVLAASLLLTLTLIPALCALGLAAGRDLQEPAFLRVLRSAYERLFRFSRRFRRWLLAACLALAAGAGLLATRLGANFMPALDEGWLVVEVQRDPQVSLAKSLGLELQTEQVLRAAVPEIRDVFSRIGMSQVATDPQGANQNDIYISFQPRSRWRTVGGRTITKAELAELIRATMERNIPGQELEFSQPIAVRFDEMLEGVRTDLAIKVFGTDYDELDRLAGRIAEVVRRLPRAGAVVIDRPGRANLMEFQPDRTLLLNNMAYGDQINHAVAIGLAGREVGRIDEGEVFYPLVVRLPEAGRTNPATLDKLPLRVLDNSQVIGLGSLGKWALRPGVNAITREQAGRREAIMVTVDGPDVAGFVAQAQAAVQREVVLPSGCRVEFSGAYQNWQSGSRRLLFAGLACLLLSLALVQATLKSWRQTALVAIGVPFALVGGVYGLWWRELPLTLPAAIGFVTLGGLSILNGLVLITCFNDLRARGTAPLTAALDSARTRLRPVLMTALVAGAGFVPMALSAGQGAEIQRPFATVVVFGILTSTALTLLLIPLLLAGRERTAVGD